MTENKIGLAPESGLSGAKTKLEQRELQKRLGQSIRMFRTLRGQTLATLAAAVGVSGQQLQKYETGNSSMSMHRFLHIADALKISPADLVLSFYASEFDRLPADFDDTVLKHAAVRDLRMLAKLFAKLNSKSIKTRIAELVDVLIEEQDQEKPQKSAKKHTDKNEK